MDTIPFDTTGERLKTNATRRGLLCGLVGATLAAMVGSAPADARPARKGGGGKSKGKGKGVNKPVGKGNGISQGTSGTGAGKGGEPDKPKTRGFNAQALGTVDEPATEGCQFGGQCTTTFVGSGTADHLGDMTFTSSLTADWSQFSGSPETGFCAPISAGEARIVASANSKKLKGSLDLTIVGTVCEDGPTGPDVPLLLSGTYEITGGTVKDLAATGTGTVEGSLTGETASLTLNGTIVY
jgi:hypothetical protein